VVLEHVPGRTLQEVIEADGPLSPDEVANILDQAASALSHLHGRGLVHLDVKPQNLMLSANGNLKLIDFGLAQPAGGPQATISGRTFGTVGYLAPEQLRGETVSASADVYALGSVAYELLTGVPPYPPPASGEVTNSMIRARLSQMPVPPSLVNPAVSLPAWVDDVVLWALAHEPGARYGSAVAFARIFRAGIEGDPLPDDIPPATLPPIEVESVPMVHVVTPINREAADPMAPPSVEAVSVPTHLGRDHSGHDAAAPWHRGRRTGLSARPLWWAVAALVIINLIVAVLLLVTQNRLPGIYEPGLIRPLLDSLTTFVPLPALTG
jgi:serine/threonine-protein kinase